MERSAHLLVSIELVQIDSFTERIIHLVEGNCEIEKYSGGEGSKTKDRLTVKPSANPFYGPVFLWEASRGVPRTSSN